MTGLVQTSSDATRSWSLSPLIVSRDSISHQTWARFQTGGASPALFGCHYIYFCSIIFIIYALRVSIFMTSPVLVVLVCCLYKEVYLHILNVCHFEYMAVAGSWKVRPVNKVYHTNWVAVVTPTNRPKSVRNGCVIELFFWLFCVVTLPFWHFCWCKIKCKFT